MPAVSEHIVRMSKAATRYPEATPLGNGRMGAMIYGDIEKETIVLNEKGMWSGSWEDSDREDAYKVLPQIRELLLRGENSRAEQLVNENFTCKNLGSNYAKGARVPFGCYQMMAYLRLYFFQYSSVGCQSEGVGLYERQLDLETAVSSVAFAKKGFQSTLPNVFYRREAFVSAPDQAFVMQLTCDEPARVSFSARLDRVECFEVVPDGEDLVLRGQLPDGFGTDKGVRYACRLRIICDGGRVWREGTTLHVQDADRARIFVTAITDIKTFTGRRSDYPQRQTLEDMNAVSNRPFEELKWRHVEEYRQYYDRMRFSLEERGDSAPDLPVDQRILRLQTGIADTGLETLLFNFDRYLFISANRPGELPGNLQGLWAEEILTPWNGDWHINAQQMLFWPAETCNLSELHVPYLELTKALVEPGERTARKYYGAKGWVAHTFTNAWLFTSPGEDAAWGSTTGSPAWQSFHMWDHFLYTGDMDYLCWAYPVMKGAAAFYQDMLIEEPKQGYVVTAPSSSPENLFIGNDGKCTAVCMGPTYDNQLLRFLFNACADAAELLHQDSEQVMKWRALARRLPPTRIAEDGRIMEWLEPYEEALPNHRHISHLWGLYPGHEISPWRDERIANAAVRSLEARGTTSAGWSISHRLGAWIRLGRGDEAYRCFSKILRDATYPNLLGRCYHAPENEADPVMPPMNDYFHPFQMDANSGVAGCVPEMVVQSHVLSMAGDWHTEVWLLPALPEAWASGEMKGLRLQGDAVMDVRWQNHALLEARLCVRNAMKITLRVEALCREIHLTAGQTAVIGDALNVEIMEAE